jgi:hypothetical protein
MSGMDAVDLKEWRKEGMLFLILQYAVPRLFVF